MISYAPATNLAAQLEPPVYLNLLHVVLVEGALSPSFSTNLPATSTGPVTVNPFKSLEAIFCRVIFYPNGSTSLRVPQRTAYLTLVSSRDFNPTLSTPPANY